jgi:hypothetical protein
LSGESARNQRESNSTLTRLPLTWRPPIRRPTRIRSPSLNEYLEPAAELMDFVRLENDKGGPEFLGK